MQAYGKQLRHYYQQQLAALRKDAEAFSRTHEIEAGALGLGRVSSRDPHVEMLMQGFAFLTGRVLYEMESAKAVLANSLLQDLYPHLAAPLPCMAIAQVDVRPDAANGASLERGRQVAASVPDEEGRPVTCRFRTTCALPLVPLAVTEVDLLQPENFPAHLTSESVLAALRVRVDRLSSESLKTLKNRRLRFYIDTTHKEAYLLQELLAVNLVGISLANLKQGHEDPQPVAAPAPTLRWLGFGEYEAALPSRPNMHPGHRLLQEYFALPEKFMFFETAPLEVSGLDEGLVLYFHFNTPITAARRLSPGALRLNCVPLVNLYAQRIDPLALDHTRYEYWLRADVQGHRQCEIHSITELTSIRADGTLRELKPYFEMEGMGGTQARDYFYVLRREENQQGEVAGTEVYISFLDRRQAPVLPPGEVVGGRALCTNRRLPEQMLSGQRLALEGPGAVKGFELLHRPSPHDTPSLVGERPWAMVCQLSLNHLSLAHGPQALSALKGMLRGHVGPSQVAGLKQVDGIQAVECRPILRPVVREGQRSLVHALHITLTLDRAHFDGSGGVVLFASVLRHFLAMYATVNAVVEVSMATMDSKPAVKRWEPLSGSQAVL